MKKLAALSCAFMLCLLAACNGDSGEALDPSSQNLPSLVVSSSPEMTRSAFGSPPSSSRQGTGKPLP